ncbi:EAL domain-containing protein [Marinobacter sp. 1_MG-2023]|uniref:bifunctional diguanylate cyclase/phosphodiesterase n=1 Tax=Marinobacter sp. 1_MG-2023 TaxID=3062627 RepID=UPI0026E489CC|nr:EAL domain-containing protein [Marinobacter sp. 1_MG-2023]MDO6822471.1 EAL domain-containing protein [Marinobacter sp. 1_MG-2023]
MSLVKQLWLATSFLVVTAFTASLAASLISAYGYYQEQLALKNIDNANSLAITLSHTEKERALLRSFLDAQFATGHYQRISLNIPNEQPLDLQGEPSETNAPAWFRALFPMDIPAGQATVSDGWVNFGALSVESETSYAQTSLWVTTKRLFVWLCLVALFAGFAGSWMIRRISDPLKGVVRQAEAIGERRFIVSKEPKTTEFRRVVRAMNKLSKRVESILEGDARALSEMREKTLHDPVTGIANREFFISRLDALVADEDTAAQHTLALVRLPNLTALNAKLGHETVSAELREFCEQVSERLKRHQHHYSDAFLGRLNGSDFGILLTGFHDIGLIREMLTQDVQISICDEPMQELRLSACTFRPGSSRAEVMMKADHLLAQAEQAKETLVIAESSAENIPFRNATEWRDAISLAIHNKELKAEFHPLIGRDGTPLHQEAKIRLKLNGDWQTAGYFLPWSRRLSLLPSVDTAMVTHLIALSAQTTAEPVVIHISTDSLLEEETSARILQLIESRQAPAQSFRLELPESALGIDDLRLSSFIGRVQQQGSEVGISGIGHNLERIVRIHELGLNYIKTDPVYAQRLESDRTTQQYLQRLTALAHSIGLQVYLAGATSPLCVQAAWEAGFDGVTGPGITTTG